MRNRWLTRRAVTLHVTIVILLPAFAWLTWWQVTRALGGNELSWAYSFEWPFFGAYAVYLWWWLIHDQDRPGEAEASSPARPGEATAGTSGGEETLDDQRTLAELDLDEGDPDLAAYNRYLATLHESGRRKTW